MFNVMVDGSVVASFEELDKALNAASDKWVACGRKKVVEVYNEESPSFPCLRNAPVED